MVGRSNIHYTLPCSQPNENSTTTPGLDGWILTWFLTSIVKNLSRDGHKAPLQKEASAKDLRIGPTNCFRIKEEPKLDETWRNNSID